MCDKWMTKEDYLSMKRTLKGAQEACAKAIDEKREALKAIKELHGLNRALITALVELQNLRDNVEEFMTATNQNVRIIPNLPPITDEEGRLRCALVIEEVFEFVEACSSIKDDVRQMKDEVLGVVKCMPIDIDMVEAADALADIDYVVEGSRLSFGIDGSKIASEVHRTNMEKIHGGAVNEDGKFCKPADWQPPDIGYFLKKQGWDG